ncbi:MAG: aspartate carbamoyltransferase [Chloroflexi bacterium]|nr:aspartate carbamoyltransferase [Chloroflexota bacterium]|tara:strand:+ start:20098 stop:21057 length:960 start_codon:yes stop_codon:yes gene_type:complete
MKINPKKYLLDIDCYSKEEILQIINDSKIMMEILNRKVKKIPTLRGKTIVTLFYEPSTRTRISFEQAGKILNADVINIATKESSSNKGESLLNTILTIQSIKADLIIIRHPHAGAPYFLAKNSEIPIINAGDGSHAHPTQSLLDLYTIHNNIGQIENLNIVMVGDILYSRVARSNILGLSILGANITLCGPKTLIPNEFLSKSQLFNNITFEHSLKKAVNNADIVMPLRIQLERQSSGHLPNLEEYSKHWCITNDILKFAKPSVKILHPGPMNEGIEISSEVAHGSKSLIKEQVTNGVAVRMALLYSMLNSESKMSLEE